MAIDIEEVRSKIKRASDKKIKLEERVSTLESEKSIALKNSGFKNVDELKDALKELNDEVVKREKELTNLLEEAEGVLND